MKFKGIFNLIKLKLNKLLKQIKTFLENIFFIKNNLRF